MTNKFNLLKYLFIFIGLIDVFIFVKIFSPVYVELILLILFILGVIPNIILYIQNKSDLKKKKTHQSISGIIFSFLFFFMVLSISPYTLKMPKIQQQSFDIFVACILFAIMFFVYKFCDSIFDDRNQLFQSRVGGFYINPKHFIGKIIFFVLFLIPIYVILVAILNGPISISN